MVQLFLLLSPSWPKCVAQLVGHPDHWWPRQPSHRQTTSDLPLCCHADQCRCQHQSCQTPLLTVPFLSPTWRAELSVIIIIIIIIIIISQTTLLDSDTFTSTINAHTHTHTHHYNTGIGHQSGSYVHTNWQFAYLFWHLLTIVASCDWHTDIAISDLPLPSQFPISLLTTAQQPTWLTDIKSFGFHCIDIERIQQSFINC